MSLHYQVIEITCRRRETWENDTVPYKGLLVASPIYYCWPHCKAMVKNCSKGNSGSPDQTPEHEQWIYFSIQIAIIIISLCGNSLLIRAFCKFSNLRTASNMIVMSLCVADILIPVSFILHMIQSALKHGSTDEIQFTFCKASAFFSFFLISVIIFHLVLISVDRFVAIKFSLRYHSILTHRRTLIASIAMWLWAALITLVLPQILKAIHDGAAFESLMHAFHPCLRAFDSKRCSNSSVKAYAIFMETTQLGIPLVIILCSYSYVYIVSHKHRSRVAAQNDAQRNLTLKQEMKGARILAITVALCLLSLLPVSTLMCLLANGKLSPQYKSTLIEFKRIAYTLAMGMNAICNPLVYGLGNQQVRQALRRMFKGA